MRRSSTPTSSIATRLPASCWSSAEARLYRPIWSKDIHEEWTRAVTRSRPDIAPEKLGRRRAAMDRALPDACVSGYQRLLPAIELPDPDDRHVVAAAIRAKAQVIVTFNMKRISPSKRRERYNVCSLENVEIPYSR